MRWTRSASILTPGVSSVPLWRQWCLYSIHTTDAKITSLLPGTKPWRLSSHFTHLIWWCELAIIRTSPSQKETSWKVQKLGLSSFILYSCRLFPQEKSVIHSLSAKIVTLERCLTACRILKLVDRTLNLYSMAGPTNEDSI